MACSNEETDKHYTSKDSLSRINVVKWKEPALETGSDTLSLETANPEWERSLAFNNEMYKLTGHGDNTDEEANKTAIEIGKKQKKIVISD